MKRLMDGQFDQCDLTFRELNEIERSLVKSLCGIYHSRIPALSIASTRSTNGSVGQTVFRASFFNEFGVTPPSVWLGLLNVGEVVTIEFEAPLPSSE